MSFIKEIKGVSGSAHATGALYAFLAGLAISDAIPTVADAFYFSKQRKLRDEFIDKKITPAQYWEREAFAYYAYNVAWWVLVGAIVVGTKGDVAKKIKVAGALIGGGAVVAVLYKNIKKDEKEMEKDLLVKNELDKSKP